MRSLKAAFFFFFFISCCEKVESHEESGIVLTPSLRLLSADKQRPINLMVKPLSVKRKLKI